MSRWSVLLGVMLTSVALAAEQNRLSWDDTSDNEDGFVIERTTIVGDVSGCATVTEASWYVLGDVRANVTTFVDREVAWGETYCYRVQAQNKEHTSGYSNVAGLTVFGDPRCVTHPSGRPAAWSESYYKQWVKANC